MGQNPKERLLICCLLICCFVICCSLVGGCDDLDDVGSNKNALTAECMVTVVGRGDKEVEADYLPHVVACENGMADTEALKAQAVAARSYMTYRIGVSGMIEDGVSDQVYTCANKPTTEHYAAVNATSGQVLLYRDKVICAFFVAGARPSTSTCVALASDPDSQPPTEWAVTYNEGKVGSQVTQSPLGSLDPLVIANRGCLSQNGSHCLSLQAKPYPEILRFYYGADIQLVTASGACVVPNPEPDASVDPEDEGLSVWPDAESADLPPSSQWDGGLSAVDRGDRPSRSDTEKSERASAPVLLGACSVSGGQPGPGSALVLLVLFLWVRGSRAKSGTHR